MGPPPWQNQCMQSKTCCLRSRRVTFDERQSAHAAVYAQSDLRQPLTLHGPVLPYASTLSSHILNRLCQSPSKQSHQKYQSCSVAVMSIVVPPYMGGAIYSSSCTASQPETNILTVHARFGDYSSDAVLVPRVRCHTALRTNKTPLII